MKTKFKITNRLLSLVLALVMVVSMLPMTTLTALAALDTSKVGGCNGDHTGYTKLTLNSSGYINITESGNYYLEQNFSSTNTSYSVIQTYGDITVTICLNGYKLTHSSIKPVITISYSNVINICDCKSNGVLEHTNADSSIFTIGRRSVCNIYGGTIQGKAGIVTNISGAGGTVNMYGGTINITDNYCVENKKNFNWYGGTITGGGLEGAIYQNGTMSVSGSPTLTKDSALYLTNGKTIDASGMTGGSIYVNAESNSNDIAITGTNSKDISSYFKSAKDGYSIINGTNNVVYLHKHIYSAATCVAPKTCSCGLTEGEKDSTNHNPATEWTAADGKHYHACLNGCGTHFDEDDCSGGTATCVNKATCDTCKKEYGSTSGHSFQYSASGNVITETCENNCGHSETATLEYATGNGTYSYTGLPIKPLKVTPSDGWQGGTLDISYSANNINVGTAKGVITIPENGVKAEQTFTITEADISGATITLDPASGEYTGNAYTPSVSVTLDGFGTLVEGVHYTVTWDKNEFINADTYTATIEGKDNFEGDKTATFIITDADITVIEVKQKDTLTYNGKEQTPTVSTSATSVNNQTITFEYSTEQDNYGAMPTFKDAGTYTVYYRATADNHIAAYGEFKVTINKQTVDVPDISSKVYNGETQTADITDTALYTVTENNGGTDAGKYNVELTLTDSKNYKWATPETTENAAIPLDFEITKATNKWTTEPTISDWTYGDTASTPNYKAKFGTVKVVYTGEANDGSDYNSETAPTKAGKYTATFTVADNSNYGGLEKAVDFEIEKATYDMSGAKWDDTTTVFNYDGKSHSVWFDEDSLPDGVTVSRYTGNTASQVDKYIANVAFAYDDNNYNPPIFNVLLDWEIVNNWTPTEYTVTKLNDNGWINGDFEITPQDGYKIATDNKDTSDWSDKLTYTAETDNGEVTFYLRNTDNNEISLAKTVNYKLDKTNPTGTVEFVGREPWQEFINTITFGLFFKEEVTVKITANDTLSDIANIEYYEADELMTLDEVKAIKNWTAYNDSFGVSVEDTKKFIYFVRITDNAGNVTYLSSNGAEYDTTDPKIEGVENNGIYYVTQKVTVKDKNLDTVTLNDTPVTLDGNGSFTLTGNTEAQYKIVATDKAGNSKTVTVTMKAISAIKAPINDKTTDNIKSADGDTVQSVIDNVAELLTDPDITDSEKAELEQIKETAETLKDKIGSTAAENTDITNKVGEYKPETVTSDDKQDIKDLIGRIDTLLDGENLTEDEKAALEETKKAAENLIKKVDDTAAESTDITDKVGEYKPETVTSDDKQNIKDLIGRIDTLLDGENLTEDEKAALEETKKTAEDLIKKVDDTAAESTDVTDKVGEYKPETVTSDDTQDIKDLIGRIDTLLDGENLTEDEKAALEETKDKAQDLLDKIDEAANADDTDNTEKVKDITADNVTPEDKSDLEKAKDDLTKTIDDYSDNLTEDEKKAIQTQIDRIDKAIAIIEKVEAVEEQINNLPENITKNDEAAIKAADEAYNALSDYEKSLVDKDVKKALDDAKAALAELNKPADSTSPNTGDNSNLWLWVALLFISGGINFASAKKTKRLSK